MAISLARLLCTALGLLGYGLACHRRYVKHVIVTHFNDRGSPRCEGQGQHCKFDRNCCAGMECRLAVEGFDIVTRCQYRKVYEDYQEVTNGPSWKDYQEIESSEEERSRMQNLEDLQRRNADLRRKLVELGMLKKSVRRQQLMDMKRRLEEIEIEELRNEKLKYGMEFNQEMDRLKEKELQDELESLEKKEVNLTLSKQQRLSGLYMNMLTDLANKED